jgi:hypothetical protein
MVNLHHSRCDALILKSGQSSVQHVPLIDCSIQAISTLRDKMKLSLKRADRNARKPKLSTDSDLLDESNAVLEEILHALWLKVVRPVLVALNILHQQAVKKLLALYEGLKSARKDLKVAKSDISCHFQKVFRVESPYWESAYSCLLTRLCRECESAERAQKCNKCQIKTKYILLPDISIASVKSIAK